MKRSTMVRLVSDEIWGYIVGDGDIEECDILASKIIDLVEKHGMKPPIETAPHDCRSHYALAQLENKWDDEHDKKEN